MKLISKLSKYIWVLPLLAFVVVQLIFARHVDPVEYDEAIYMNVARSIRQTGIAWRPTIGGGILYAEHTSLYQHIWAFLTLFFGENVFFGRLLTSIIGALTIFLLYHFVQLVTKSSFAALISAFLLSFSAFFNLYSFFIREEVWMSLLLVSSAYLFWVAEQTDQKRYLWLSSITVALAVLTKEIAIIFWGAMGLYILVFSKSWRTRIKDGLILALPTLIGLGLWVTWIKYHAPNRFAATLARWFDSIVGISASTVQEPRGGIEMIPWLRIVFDDVWGYGLLGTLLLALIITIWRQKRPPRIAWLTLGYVVIAISLSLFIELKEPRHLIATIPFAVLSVAFFMDWAWVQQWLHNNRKRQILAIMLFFLCISQTWIWQYPAQGEWRNKVAWYRPKVAHRLFHEAPYYSILRDVGVFINQQLPADAQITVVHEGPVVAYYSERPYVFLYNRSADGIDKILDNTMYLIFDQPTFVFLSQDEIDLVYKRIEQEFNLLSTIKDEHRTVNVYQRIETLPVTISP